MQGTLSQRSKDRRRIETRGDRFLLSDRSDRKIAAGLKLSTASFPSSPSLYRSDPKIAAGLKHKQRDFCHRAADSSQRSKDRCRIETWL